jgi:hypothetical protein
MSYEPAFSSSSEANRGPPMSMKNPLQFPIEADSDSSSPPDDCEIEPPLPSYAPETRIPTMDRLYPVGTPVVIPSPYGKSSPETNVLFNIVNGLERSAKEQYEKELVKQREESKRLLKALAIAFVGGLFAGGLAYAVFKSRYSSRTSQDES